MKTISSRQNALVARCRAVARGDDRDQVLLDGLHLVAEALASGVAIDRAIVSAGAAARPDIASLIGQLERRGVEVIAAGQPVMAAVSPVRSSSPLVALAARPVRSEEELYGRTALVVVTCDVQDPGNVGAIARVAEAAGASGMVTAGESADPFGWKALRGSMGSALRLPIISDPQVPHALAQARSRGCRILALSPRAERSIFDSDLKGPLAMLVGGEGSGLSEPILEEADMRLRVPMRPPVESLNAAVTAALVLYEASRQRA